MNTKAVYNQILIGNHGCTKEMDIGTIAVKSV